MRKIVVFDRRDDFINDISTRQLLAAEDNEYNFEVVDMYTDTNMLESQLSRTDIDEICLNAKLEYLHPTWNVKGPKITFYSNDMNGVSEVVKKNLNCYGVATTAGELMNLLNANELVATETKKEVKDEIKSKPIILDDTNELDDILDVVELADETPKADTHTQTVNNEPASNDDEEDDIEAMLFGKSESEPKSEPIPEPTKTDKPKPTPTANPKPTVAPTPVPEPEPKRNYDVEEGSLEDLLFGKGAIKEDIKTLRDNIEAEEEKERQRDYEIVDAGLTRRKKKTQVITTYSAKGGVGKTTIACNLATYLAMTSNGRRNNRVCIIDYNFDFGDVLNTLAYDSKGVTMTEWVQDIQDRIGNGEKPESIVYDRRGVESFLQRKNDSGLYALLAPTSHKDSLIIHSRELNIMINSILKYGDFDYVICDTGNNTRNSSMLSLSKADNIVMVTTQDVTTVYDNQTFLDTVKALGTVDEDRIVLVINKARSKKETLVSCKEVEDSLDIPCVAEFEDSADVIKSNNAGRPLVYNQKHSFTAGISNIAARVTGIGEYTPVKRSPIDNVVNKVKGFFGF